MTLKQAIKCWLWQHFRERILVRKGLRSLDVMQDEAFLDLFFDLYVSERRCILSLREKYNIYRLVGLVQDTPGALAEVGVFQGGSARVMCEANTNGKDLHLFDTFEGMPETDRERDRVGAGVCAGTSLEDVQAYLQDYPFVDCHKGCFPDSVSGLPDDCREFAFVHLDVDIYRSTLDGLRFFYPRMSRGGMILSHDYRSTGLPGVRRAFDEFMADKPEPVVPLWDSQGLVVKM